MTRRAWLLLALLGAMCLGFVGPGGSGVRFWAELASSLTDRVGGAASTFTSTGPLCDLTTPPYACVADDAPLFVGGALRVNPSITNSVLQSEDLSTTWTAVGTDVVSCGHASTAWADSRTVCKITDDDASVIEHIRQDINISALNAGDPILLCLHASADSAGSLDVRLREQTGASCTQSDHDYALVATTSTWTKHCFAATVSDDGCEVLRIYVLPDGAEVEAVNVSATGHAYVTGVQVILGTATEPNHYCATTTVARSCGADAPSWNIAGSALTTPANLAVAVADGDMEDADGAPTSAWTATGGATLSKQSTNPHGGAQVLRVTNTGSFACAQQTIPLVVGRKYGFGGWGRSDGSATICMGDSGDIDRHWTGTTSTDWQDMTDTFVAAQTDFTICYKNIAGEHYAEFDDITITDITEELRGTIEVSFDWTPSVADFTSSQNILFQMDDGTSTNYVRLIVDSAERYRLYNTAAPAQYDITSAAQVIAPGATYGVRLRINCDTDIYGLYVDGVLLGSYSTARACPPGISTLRIASSPTGVLQPDGGAGLSDPKASRR